MKDVDRLVDRKRSQASPGEALEETFLDDRPVSQWPPYIDETATDIVADIGVGDTGLDRFNFPREVGPRYQKGILASVGSHSDLPDAFEHFEPADLGRVAFLLNKLSYEIQRSDTGLDDINRAVTAILEKLLSDVSERGVTPHLGDEVNSTADILIRMLSHPDVASQVETVLDQFEAAYDEGLLAKLDEPQMTTPLWDHQRDALEEWLAADRRGYVDMATATGKTVLGLAAIASQYGSLHPLDADLDPGGSTPSSPVEVLIVAHNDLILEQWRREFDRHLNIPSDRTAGDDVELTWGSVHFRTAQRLLNQETLGYDLVVLDEAHHYASGTGWGQLLEQFDADVLALSGSVDAGGEETSRLRDRLESTIGPELKRYSLAQAQDDGVIPTFDWAVRYVPADVDEEFVEITERAQTRFDAFRRRLGEGALDIDTDRRLETYDDIRHFSHTTRGKELKKNDDQFRDLVTTLFSRRTQRWNQSPSVDAVVDAVTEHANSRVVVLTNNNAQVDAVTERLSEHDGVDDSRVFALRRSDSSQRQRDTVERFDSPDDPGVLVGTGDRLGEGVDMHHADVGINMATGSVNKQLIQRIGRVLRNPGADKHARFVNLVGIPTRRGAQAPPEDGQLLLEDAVQLDAFGASFDNRPTYEVVEESTSPLERLLEAGRDRIRSLDAADDYDWPEGDRATVLQEYLDAIEDDPDARTVLQAWSVHGRSDEERSRATQVVVRAVTPDETPVADAFVSLVSDDTTQHGRTNGDGEVTFENVTETCTAGVHHPETGVDTVTIDPSEDTPDEIVTVVTGEST